MKNAVFLKKRVKGLFFFFIFAFLFLFGLSYAHYRHYARYQSVEFTCFRHYTYNPYKDGQPMESIDFSRIGYLWDWRASGGTSDEWTERYGELEQITACPLPHSITYYTRNIDYGMYLNRIYFSPDFWRPLWNPALTLTLSLTLLSGLGWLFLARRAARKT